MDPFCLRHDQLPGASRLFRDYLYDFGRLAGYYGQDPHDAEAFARAVPRDYPAERRAAIVSALGVRNSGNPLLERLGREGTVAVVTGQQVGLFGGPLYSVYKALTAIRTADWLTERGVEAVPVFWLATEDHDFAEIDHYPYVVPGRELAKARLEWVAPERRPVGWIEAGGYPRAEVEAAVSGLPFGDEAVELLRGAYADGTGLGEAFQRLMEGLLGAGRLLYVDPLEGAVRKVGAPVMGEVARRGVELGAAVRERSRELERAGYHAQVHIEAETSLFFRLEEGQRIALKARGGEYVAGSRKYSLDELAGEPERLSPNALVRSVMQDFMLPTVAYVGGPGELAYMAQSEVVYRSVLGRMPVMLPRASFTLVDGRCQKVMERHRMTLPEVCTYEAEMKERFARRLVPAELSGRVRGTCEQIQRELGEMREDLARFDPTLGASLDKSAAKIRHQLKKIQDKAAREALRRDRAAAEDAGYLHRNLYPRGHLQERYLGMLPFYARYGAGLVETLESHVNLACPDHIVLPV
jgi:bacillithiol biosynthesis cysteine-adding enzyme BshC